MRSGFINAGKRKNLISGVKGGLGRHNTPHEMSERAGGRPDERLLVIKGRVPEGVKTLRVGILLEIRRT